MNDSRSIALLIAYGSEVRAFLHSGLATELRKKWPIVVVARTPESRAFAQVGDLRVVSSPPGFEVPLLVRFRSLANNAQRRFLERKGFHFWQQNIRDATKGRRFPVQLMHGLFGQSALGVKLAIGMERLAAARWGSVVSWQRVFQEIGARCVVSTVYGSAQALPAIQTAANLGLKTIVIMHSWKDAYTHPRIPVPLSRLGLWSDGARRDLLTANPWFPPDRTKVIGSLHLSTFYQSENYIPREEFNQMLGLEPNRPFICYTTAAPGAVKNEQTIIAGLVESVSEGGLPKRPQLLLRVNPMDDTQVMSQFAGRPGIIVHRPAWEWNRRQDWCCALASDVPVWVSTVMHAALNVSIPSTVTLEFAVFGKPVVNVCYDLPSPLPPSRSNRRFWEAPHYEESRTRGLCAAAYSEGELLAHIGETLQRAQDTELPQVHGSEMLPVERAAELVEEALAT